MSGSQAAIDFRYFPATTWRVPGFNAEFSASQANNAVANQRALLVGQILSSGTATVNQPVVAYSQAQVNLLCGVNSMLALLYQAYRLQDAFGEVWILPLADNSAGTAATGSMAITGPATAAGTLALYVTGLPVPVPVNLADTATVIATNVAAAINSTPNMPCTASSAAGVVTLTARHKGLAQMDTDMRLNYVGIQNNEVTPPGVAVAFTAFAGGATNPVLTTAFANLGTKAYDYIAMPYTDSVSMAAVVALLSDQSGRWSAVEMLYGHAFYAYRGTVSARSTFGNSNNNQHETILGFFDSPTPAWLEAADWAGAHAAVLRTNPALGIVGQPLNLLPPPIASQDTPAEMNVLLYDGISTFTVDESNQSRIGRTITTYQTNSAGQPDNSYLATNLLFQAMYAARYIQTQILTQYLNKILVIDGTPIGPGSPATTPSLVFQGVCAIYAYLCTTFIVQDAATFSKNGYAQQGQKGQVLLYLPIDFGDQVINIAALIQFQQTT